MTDADTSEDVTEAAREDGGVLANLPRTRPQRSSARRTAARDAARVANGARPTRDSAPTGDPDGAPSGKPARKSTRPPSGDARKTAGSASAKPSAGATRKGATATRSPGTATSAKRRAGASRKRTPRLQDAAPRQGFECDNEASSGSVQPPGGAEFVATAAEVVGELAKAGLSTGERVLRDLVSRLPLS